MLCPLRLAWLVKTLKPGFCCYCRYSPKVDVQEASRSISRVSLYHCLQCDTFSGWSSHNREALHLALHLPPLRDNNLCSHISVVPLRWISISKLMRRNLFNRNNGITVHRSSISQLHLWFRPNNVELLCALFWVWSIEFLDVISHYLTRSDYWCPSHIIYNHKKAAS